MLRRALAVLVLPTLAISCSDEGGVSTTTVSPLVCADGEFGSTTLDVGEVNLHVACQGSGEPVILLHGYPEAHFSWTKLASALAPEGYRAIAPDLRGYGLSDKPEGVEPYQMEHLAADVGGLLDAVCDSPCLVVGHDWGGTLAFILANRAPQRVRGIVVISGPHPDIWGRPEVDPVQAEAQNRYVPLLVGPNGEDLFASFDALFTPHVTPDELALYHEAWARPGAKVAMNNWYRANLAPAVTLPTDVTVSLPTLVLWGKDDVFATTSELSLLPQWISNLEIIEYEGADHFFYLSRTEEVKGDILDFARALSAP
jgi:pimeloyl-ACP methyl ester carboxylesterase